MIDLQTLTISYGKKVLVDSVNAEFAPGTVYGLVAPNGHGKTTAAVGPSATAGPHRGPSGGGARPAARR